MPLVRQGSRESYEAFHIVSIKFLCEFFLNRNARVNRLPMTAHTPAQLTPAEEQLLADRIHRLTAELNRAIADAAQHNILSGFQLIPDPKTGRAVLKPQVFKHVDFPEQATAASVPPGGEEAK